MSHANRLARETSPYLLQHAHNPVDWYPWGPEAFAAARSQNKPIFLSVGYSTCYWCHVMERESFENEAFAREMNERFISIKVDREERPDVDQLYMTAVQVLTRHGGWPMSVFLLPDLRPFYGGTYFPPTDMHGRPSFLTVLRSISDAFHNRKADVEKSASQLADILRQLAHPPGPAKPLTIDQAFIEDLITRSTADFDATNGGFGTAPKFPRETLLELLLTANQSQIADCKPQILASLDAMAYGGIRDHLGGGFHRYSTDARWLVPHFEIMLYDNAMLGWIYAEASRQFSEWRYASVARDIFHFTNLRMTSPNGAFYTAFDAEVDAREGGSYLWTADEVEAVLGPDDAAVFNRVYGLDRGPNFADPHQGTGVPDRNVLYVADRDLMDQCEGHLIDMRFRLWQAREKRKQPLLDTKIITSWNALMIRAMAHAGRILNEPKYIEWAATAADFLLRNHRRPDGTLYRTSRNGTPKYDGFLDDYAFLAQALLALHDAGDTRHVWKEHAQSIAMTMIEKFGDDAGGFYFSDGSATDLVVRQMTAQDSPLPSGAAVATLVMIELGQFEIAQRTIATFARQLDQYGESMSAMVQAAMQFVQMRSPIQVAPRAARDDALLPPNELAQRIVAVSTRWTGATELELELSILKGYHIAGHNPSPGLFATELSISGAEVERIDFPSGPTYEWRTVIHVWFKEPPTSSVRIALRYQPCNDAACLPPVTKTLEVGP